MTRRLFFANKNVKRFCGVAMDRVTVGLSVGLDPERDRS